MRIFVTGATGFVGAWLCRELEASGHEVVGAPQSWELDITDRDNLRAWLAPGPDAVVHLAGMAFAPDARADPAEAFRVNVAGTVALFEALRELRMRPPVLVTGSSDVYGSPRPGDLPLSESAPIAPRQPYAISKAAQEGVAVELGVRDRIQVVVARAFNHTGPGQRPVFVVPALARRVEAVRRGLADHVPAGNVDVRRDIGDVRDVVHAYRLLVERAAAGFLGDPPLIVNVGTGRSVAIREVIERLGRLAQVNPMIRVDPNLVRADDPPEIVSDSTLLRDLTGWSPDVALDQTLQDLIAEAADEHARIP